MVIVNPGNSTGQCLSHSSLKEILQFCDQEKLVLLADEVYQQNVYQEERPFISAKKVISAIWWYNNAVFSLIFTLVETELKVLMDLGPPMSKKIQLVSFHSVSKGYWGECGQRGGYFEMINIPPQVWFCEFYSTFLNSYVIRDNFLQAIFFLIWNSSIVNIKLETILLKSFDLCRMYVYTINTWTMLS